MAFQKDLKIGNKAEDFVINLFNNHGWSCTKSDKAASHDFIIQNDTHQFSFECKFDKMAARTGNIAIEFFNPKKKKESGITVSCADFWVYCFQSDGQLEAYLIKLNKLFDYISSNTPFRIIDVGGDDNASLLLYKKDKILSDVFVRIDNLGNLELLEILLK